MNPARARHEWFVWSIYVHVQEIRTKLQVQCAVFDRTWLVLLEVVALELQPRLPQHSRSVSESAKQAAYGVVTFGTTRSIDGCHGMAHPSYQTLCSRELVRYGIIQLFSKQDTHLCAPAR